MASSKQYEVDFFTATILEWKPLLSHDCYKDIVISSIRNLVQRKIVAIHAFVIMNNHMHILWHVIHPYKRKDVQRDMLKYTAQTIIRELKNTHPHFLNDYYVGAKDRQYQIWERNPLTISIWSEEVLKQKLEYIHNNPVKAELCAMAEDYKYSSASVYSGADNDFDFVTPWNL
jgi:putative transposase